MSIRNLECLLAPRSVAVFGASDRIGSVGATVWRNLRAGGFAGPIHAVNPKRRELDGEPSYPTVSDLPIVPDLAVLCTPPAGIPDLIARIGDHGTRAAIVVSAGLDAGVRQAALDAARPHLLRVLGPNCLGLMTPRLGLNASFAHANAIAGDLAFVSQSGALVTAMLDWAGTRGIGFSHLVSLGESADVDFGDLLDYLANDGATGAILLYIESIRASRKFMSAARAAARNKPVIVVKAGRAGHGLRAAASHTGALAGSDVVFDAVIRRAGMLRVDTLQDLFTAAQTLARLRANTSDRLTIMTNGGGGGVMAADAAARDGVVLHELDAPLRARLDAALPPTWSGANPIDIIGDAPVERYVATLSALIDTPECGAVLFLHAPTAIVASVDIARACAPLASTARHRVMGCWLGDRAVEQARGVFRDADIADYATPEEAVRAFAMLVTYRRNQEILREAPPAVVGATTDLDAARAIVRQALAAGRAWLSEPEAKGVLHACGIPVVRTQVVAPDADAAVAAARVIGHPVALKILSPDITHKSDVGGVRLQLRNDADVRTAADAMLATVREARPDARIEGITVQAMVNRPRAEELIVGASIDPVFGPVLLFGQGGTSVEVVGDTAVALPPLNRLLAAELISRTRVSRLLAGYRDRPAARVESIIDVLLAVAQMLVDLPELAELDINPLLADADGVIALDARIRVSAEPVAGAGRFAIRPYPAHLTETMAWQGADIVLRAIRPEDEAQHRAFLERLDPVDLRMRIFYSRREFAREELARLTQIDYAREMAFIAERTGADGRRETLGTVRSVTDSENNEAEFAIIVRSDCKHLGLGHLLLDKLVRHACAEGTRTLVGAVLRENTDMLDLARECGFVRHPARPGDDGVVYLALSLLPPAPAMSDG